MTEVFYTSSLCNRPMNEDRWHDDGIGFMFFDTVEEARDDLDQLRKSLASDPEAQWSPMQIEKVTLAAESRRDLLRLLNEGVGSIVVGCEVVEVVE